MTSATRDHRTDAGQASIEFTGLIGVLAVVLALAAGLGVAHGAGFVNAVGGAMQQALCRVTGGDCAPEELEACTVRSSDTGFSAGLRFTVVELGGSLSLLREERSDGTVDVSLVDAAEVAPTASIGASGGVRLGGDRQGQGAVAKAELLVRLGRRRVWRVPDREAARRLERRIAEHVAATIAERTVPGGPLLRRVVARVAGVDVGRLPPPDASGVSGGVEGAVEAELPLTATVRAGAAASLGGLRDHRTGERTLVFSLEGSGAASLLEAVGGGALQRSAGVSITLVHDRDGQPVELVVGAAGMAVTGLGLDGPPQVTGPPKGGGRTETTATLDLRRPEHRAAADRVLGALAPGRAGQLAEATGALAELLRRSARRDVLVYGSRSNGWGADAEASAVGGLGGRVEITRATAALTDAWTRPAGGAWEPRADCLGRRGA